MTTTRRKITYGSVQDNGQTVAAAMVDGAVYVYRTNTPIAATSEQAATWVAS